MLLSLLARWARGSKVRDLVRSLVGCRKGVRRFAPRSTSADRVVFHAAPAAEKRRTLHTYKRRTRHFPTPNVRSPALVLQKAGYVTQYSGKYLNAYGNDGQSLSHVPPGWDEWVGLRVRCRQTASPFAAGVWASAVAQRTAPMRRGARDAGGRRATRAFTITS